MSDLDALLQRNKHFATTPAWKQADFRPRHAVFAISCLDPRVDPFALLELSMGNAIVVRHLGGRVTQAALDDMAYIGYLQRKLIPGGPTFEVTIVHHNQCGSSFLADPEVRAGYMELMESDDETALIQRGGGRPGRDRAQRRREGAGLREVAPHDHPARSYLRRNDRSAVHRRTGVAHAGRGDGELTADWFCHRPGSAWNRRHARAKPRSTNAGGNNVYAHR
ncbi:hypothetical protein M6D93_12360 [Jatrophihabitans telluris]|uniref:Carbonic anhydrase n=1 Tax=Jatrophihabitans telluris TaxID=2038343 RepID=A0ABY4QTU8_9ACTN|nr:hypothetical protein [Jatrophihabitans telluris]UQX87095.1 hypothetical protein M6D93_12360 [Jatrophihabitans telluris]